MAGVNNTTETMEQQRSIITTLTKFDEKEIVVHAQTLFLNGQSESHTDVDDLQPLHRGLLDLPGEVIDLIVEQVVLEDNRQAEKCCEQGSCECHRQIRDSLSLARTSKYLNSCMMLRYFTHANIPATNSAESWYPPNYSHHAGVAPANSIRYRNPDPSGAGHMKGLVSTFDLLEDTILAPPQSTIGVSLFSLKFQPGSVRFLELGIQGVFSLIGGLDVVSEKLSTSAIALKQFPELRTVTITISNRNGVRFPGEINTPWRQYLPIDGDIYNRTIFSNFVGLLHDVVACSPKLARIHITRDVEGALTLITSMDSLKAVDFAAHADASLEGLSLTFIDNGAKLPLNRRAVHRIAKKVYACVTNYTKA